MKSILIAIIGAATTVVSGYSQTINELVAKLPPTSELPVQQRAIVTEARANPDFYTALKAAGWKFGGVALTDRQIVSLAFAKADYAAITPLDAARFLQTEQYKTWSAAKVLQLGETIAAYDWLQEQRLIVVQAQPKDASAKSEYLVTVANQVIAAAKAKQ